MTGAWREGPWRLRGARELFEGARPELERAAREQRGESGIRAVGPYSAYFKGSPLRARPALRHAVRRAAGLELPRLNEFVNLEWLRAHGFLAARPLLAGARMRAGLPRYQFLFSELVPGARTLAQHLRASRDDERAAVLAALALDVARLHRLGFVHRDLFPRNLLAGAAGAGPRCHVLDAWRGGPRRGLRGPDHDLGCLFLDGAELFTPTEQRLFLGTYRDESQRLGRVLHPQWPARVQRARAAVLRRERRRRPGLVDSWKFPGGA